MAWIEVYGGQRSLALELKAPLYYEWKYIKNVR